MRLCCQTAFADRLARITALERRCGIGPALGDQCPFDRVRAIIAPAFSQRISAGTKRLKAAIFTVHHRVSPYLIASNVNLRARLGKG